MLKFTGLCLLTALLAPTAHAGGNECVGGGDVVMIREGNRVSTHLLDYDMGLKLGYLDSNADLVEAMGPETSEDPVRKVRRIVDRVRRLDPQLAERADMMLELFEMFLAEPGPRWVPLIHDENLEQPLASSETLVQAAYWELNEDGVIDSWQVDPQVWAALDAIDRAGLILHELFYIIHVQEMLIGHTERPYDSREVRRFVAKISSPWIVTASRREWKDFRADVGLFIQ